MTTLIARLVRGGKLTLYLYDSVCFFCYFNVGHFYLPTEISVREGFSDLINLEVI